MNTLLYHFGGLGDFITTLPLISYWKKLRGGNITLLGKPAFGDLARKAGNIDTVLDADSTNHLFLFQRNSDRELLRRFFSPFDAVLLFAAADSPLIDNVCTCSSADILWQTPFPKTRTPITDYHLSLAAEISSLTIDQRTPSIDIEKDAFSPLLCNIPAEGGRMVAIHPGSGSRRKNWPLTDFLSVAIRLRNQGMAVLWIVGPAESAIDLPGNDILLVNRPLSELAIILSRCTVFIGNDSGITHLAAACGCPTVALFGPSDPLVWGPRGRGGVKIICHPLSCSPCHFQTDIPPECSGECLRRIDPEDVITAVEELLR